MGETSSQSTGNYGMLSPRVTATLNKAKPILVSLGWGITISSITLAAIFQGFLVPQGLGKFLPEVTGGGQLGLAAFFASIFVVSILASFLINDVGKALFAFFASYVLAGAVTYFVLALPGFVGAYAAPEVLVRVAIIFTFTASFPIPLVVELVGTLTGSWLAERFL
jgi:hypothetical protein